MPDYTMKRNHIVLAAIALAVAVVLSAHVPRTSARTAREHAGAAVEHAQEAADESASAVKEAVNENVNDTSSGGVWRTIMSKLHSQHEASTDENNDKLEKAHQRSAFADIQAKLASHHQDTSAVDEGAASVLARIKYSIERAATRLGLKSTESHYDAESQLTADEPETSMADRLLHFFRHQPVSTYDDTTTPGHSFGTKLKEMAGLKDDSSDFNDMSDQLLKAVHARPKTLGDRVADSLEAVGLKDKPAVKAAAESVADTVESYQPYLADMPPSTKMPVWDRLLKSVHLREKSTIEKAADAYGHALHEMKVALGAEDPFLIERLNTAFADATNRVHDVTTAAYAWLRHVTPGVTDLPSEDSSAHEGEAASFLSTARGAWDDLSARTLSSLLRARNVAEEYSNAALEKTGYHPERETTLKRARSNLDSAMHKLLLSLGYTEPTFSERMRSYLPTGQRSQHGGRVGAKLQSAGLKSSGVLDSTLKALHLRDKTTVDKARERYEQALHNIKVNAKLEDPTVAEQLTALLDRTYNRVFEATGAARDSLPEKASQWNEVIAEQYSAAGGSVRQQLDSILIDTDAALKQLGVRDKTTQESIRDNVNEAFHSLKASLGYEAPTFRDRLSALSGTSGGGMWDTMLKTLGLREKTALENARDKYFDSLHRVKLALGAEDPTLTEQVSAALEGAKDRVSDATQYMLSYVPGDMRYSGERAGEHYDDLSSRAMAGLLHTREEVNRLLKRSGLKERSKLEEARDAMDTSLHDLWVMLGYEEPSLLERLEHRWLQTSDAVKRAGTAATSKLGFESAEPAFADRISGRMEASIDNAGEAMLAAAESASENFPGRRAAKGFFSSIKDRFVGA